MMTETTKALEVQEQSLAESDGMERTRSELTFIPRSDIYETEDNLYLTLDMPGASEGKIDITLEQNILTISGISSNDVPEGYSLTYSEFQDGDYERRFRLTDRIDRDNIEARFQNGVLKITLPKAEEARTRKISVKYA